MQSKDKASEKSNSDTSDSATSKAMPKGKAKAALSSQVVTAESVQAEEVPTIPLGSLQTVNSLQPEVAVRSVASTKSIQLPTPLVAQPSEYRRSLGEWIQVWWEGIRPQYLPLALMPILLGTVLAWMRAVTPQTPFGSLRFLHFVVLIVAVAVLQLGANLVNDYYDYIKGVDASNTLGPGELIQQGLIKPIHVLTFGLLLLGAGTFLGILVALSGNPFLYILGLVGLLCAYFFSATSYSLSSLGLSELVSFLIYGPMLTLAAYLVQAGSVNRPLLVTVVLYSLPLGLLATAIVHVNNMRDAESDIQAGKRTLASMLGLAWSRALYVLLVLGAYALIVALGLPHHAPHLLLITLWTLPTLAIVLTGIARADLPATLHIVMRQTLKLHVLFALLLMVALVATALIPVLPHIPSHLLPF